MITNALKTWTLAVDGMVVAESNVLADILREAYGCGGASLWAGDCRIVRGVGSASCQDYDMSSVLRTLAVHNRETRILLADRATAAHRADYYKRLRQAIKSARLYSIGANPRAYSVPMRQVRQSAGYKSAHAGA